jgi:hypothetical protein
MKIPIPRQQGKSRAKTELFSTCRPWYKMMKMRVPSTTMDAPTPNPEKKYSFSEVSSL